MSKRKVSTYESFEDNIDAHVERVMPDPQALSAALRWAQLRLARRKSVG